VDVSGHGAASALLAVAVGRLLTAHASASSLLVHRASESSPLEITPPAEVARELNRRFPMESQNGLYFTMAYGILNIETNDLKYVVAGHPPLIHVPRGGGPHVLPGDGFAIGMIEDIGYDEHSLRLQPGDRVYYYSDGVPEAMNANLDQFTDERMLAELEKNGPKGLSANVDDLFDAVRAWCQPKGPKDDVSILGCEVVAAACAKR
jgi:sigma-B regulation protein RsbU (phosphoserine phosphatase)